MCLRCQQDNRTGITLLQATSNETDQSFWHSSRERDYHDVVSQQVRHRIDNFDDFLRPFLRQLPALIIDKLQLIGYSMSDAPAIR
ncbi:hypothetical protein D3C87_2011800 [compost metagenome]